MDLGIGKRIKQKRQELGLTQLELAQKMGYTSRAAICKVEKGQDNITSDRVTKFANALGCSESYIMGWEISGGATVETEPGTAYVLPLHGINSEDRKLLDQYHTVSPETRAAIDLLLKADQQKP